MTSRCGLVIVLVATLLGLSGNLAGQWLKLPDKEIPRTKDGKPDLSAPAPHKADGKPDLSGIWLVAGPKYLRNLAADLKPDEVPMQPWAAALTKERMTGVHASEESDANCLPQGVPKVNATPVPFKIVQNPDEVIILYEAFGFTGKYTWTGASFPTIRIPPGWVTRWVSGMGMR